ncbi:GerMN domain-containing protein [Nonomuraea rhodomycinica]|uniref:GerMN domain-containing protein n=1 Tax=Nonomuraea rhodomycinica TaxID=1712872 RepID=A0A7Y6INM1_9ACTN|nr:GerMN domain-containing protein [Nonomuraea rhodomycinica]NUW41078.1 GerMN domain-containing protein [Nonomuraea rhodomycinica]
MKELLVAAVLALSPAQAAGSPAAPAPDSPVQAVPAGGASGKPREVKVYFSKGHGIPGKVVAVTRKAPDRGVARFAVQQLIAGPTKAERRRGLHSELTGKLRGRSTCGADFTVAIRKGVATLRFCRTVVSDGVGGDARALYTIDRTLKQFAGVRDVISLDKKGRCLFDQSGTGRACLTAHE